MSAPARVLLIGGSGFIGTRLCARLLDEGWSVRIADKAPSARFPALRVACDVRSPEQLRDACRDVDVVVNLAAEHRDDVRPLSLYDEVNVQGARNVCEAATEAGVRRLIFTSSVAIYGFASEERHEESPARPFNDYGRTKWEAEGIYRSWVAESPERSLVVVRPTVVFGEGNRGNVFNLVRQIASGRFVMIGDGRNRKSVAYVENVAAFLVACHSLGAGEHVFNYADKPDWDMNGFVAAVRRGLGRDPRVGLRLPRPLGLAAGAAFDLVARVTGRSFPVSAVRVRKFTENTRIGADRVAATGFRPPVGLDEALGRFLAAEFRGAPGR
jgi:nucleoside-diphosphate-sugar epimerase